MVTQSDGRKLFHSLGAAQEIYVLTPKCFVVVSPVEAGDAETRMSRGPEEWVNNCWWGWQSRTDLDQCTHQCDGTQRNNNTQALSTKIVFFKCKKIDNKRSSKQRRGQAKKELMYKNVKNDPDFLFLFLYISSLSVLFFACYFFCCLSSYARRRQFLSKALVYCCFFASSSSSSSFFFFFFSSSSSSSSSSSAYLLPLEEDNFCRKPGCTIISSCFVALVGTFPKICSILSAEPLVALMRIINTA